MKRKLWGKQYGKSVLDQPDLCCNFSIRLYTQKRCVSNKLSVSNINEIYFSSYALLEAYHIHVFTG